MNNLLIFFALPIAVIIISIALQKIFKSPLLVSAIVFAIFLIVTFVINDTNLLVATIIYAILSFVTSTLVCVINNINIRFKNLSYNNLNGITGSNQNNDIGNNTNNYNNSELLALSKNKNNNLELIESENLITSNGENENNLFTISKANK